MGWPTFAQVISAAARELGLVSADISNPFASTDPNVLQLNSLLNKAGADLARRYSWSQLQLETTLTTLSGEASYALPSDFGRIIEGTMWNRTRQWPALVGNPQAWQAIEAQTSSGLVQKLVRIKGGAIYLLDTPTASETFAYEYQSRFWARHDIPNWANSTAYVVGDYVVSNVDGLVFVCTNGGTSAALPDTGPEGYGIWADGATALWQDTYVTEDAAPPLLDAATAAGDHLYFDFRLLVDALKLEFRKTKGLDTASEQDSFDSSLAASLGGDGVSETLSLNSSRGTRFIDASNAPERGYG